MKDYVIILFGRMMNIKKKMKREKEKKSEELNKEEEGE